jgi:hypothetical protein
MNNELLEQVYTTMASIRPYLREIPPEGRSMFDEAFGAVGSALAQPDPQPYGIVYEWDSPFGTRRSFTYEKWNGKSPDRHFSVYLAAQHHGSTTA